MADESSEGRSLPEASDDFSKVWKEEENEGENEGEKGGEKGGEKEGEEEEEKITTRRIGPDPGFFWDERDESAPLPEPELRRVESVFNVDIPEPFQFSRSLEERERLGRGGKPAKPPPAETSLNLFQSTAVTATCVSVLKASPRLEPEVARAASKQESSLVPERKAVHSARSARVSWSEVSSSSSKTQIKSARKRRERKSLVAQTFAYCRAVQEISPADVPDFRRFLCRCPWLRLPSAPRAKGSDSPLMDIWATVANLKLTEEIARREEKEQADESEDRELRGKFLYRGVGLCAYERAKSRPLFWPM